MTEERILDAVERIDGAMSRIETAARDLPRGAPASAGLGAPAGLGAALGAGLAAGLAADGELRQRHDTMRERVGAAITELDTMIRNG